MSEKIEFIESYIKVKGGDYQWNDNHGELIRCENCWHYDPSKRYECCLLSESTEPDGYCWWAEKKGT